LLLGIGNTLLSDEGVGVHVIRFLAERFKGLEQIQVIDGGTLSFTLLADVQNYDNLIVIDAAELQAAPGETRCFEGAAMDRHLRAGRKSVHEVGLSDLLDMARLSDHLPANRALIGIQPASTDWGEHPTAAVAAAIPGAADMACDLLEKWDTDNKYPQAVQHINEHSTNVYH